MKNMKDLKFKTRRKALFILDFMTFMPFMVKYFLPLKWITCAVRKVSL